MLLPHQRTQASLSTGSGGFELLSAEARRTSALVGSMVATLPEVLADLLGIIGESPEGASLSSAAFGGAPGTSATCTGFRRKS